MPDNISYQAILARQSDKHDVFSFCASVKEVFEFATIDRIGRTQEGKLKGFQRPQIQSHILEIRDYLAQVDSVLPNSIVVAFTSGVEICRQKNGLATITIDVSNDQKGLIVDGQQRLSALAGLPEKDFQVFVSGLICSTEEELRKQFILINNTKPLPKPLIYELLPSVNGLPFRLSSRSVASALVERLNYDDTSSLKGQILQHTNPNGTLKDTALQRIIMASLSDGVMREISRKRNGLERCFRLISNFFQGVQEVFKEDWVNHTPRTSRLVHGAGITAMGYVMEALHTMENSSEAKEFTIGLRRLVGKTAWSSGVWNFGKGETRPWNSIQNLHRDYIQLAQILIRLLK